MSVEHDAQGVVGFEAGRIEGHGVFRKPERLGQSVQLAQNNGQLAVSLRRTRLESERPPVRIGSGPQISQPFLRQGKVGMRFRRLGTQLYQAPVMTQGLFQLTLAHAGLRHVAQRFRIVGMESKSLPEQLTGFLVLARFEC